METSAARPRTPVVTTILAINVVVFLAWHLAAVPPAVMADHFVVSWDLLAAGRPWTAITTVFSHYAMFHLVVNMIVLTSFAPPLETLMGSRRFLAFYLAAGVSGSLGHAAVSNFLLDRPGQAALGASSAISGVLLLFALLFPRARVLFFFILPLPAIVAALAFIGIDVWGLVAQVEGGGLPIGHGAHLGGALAGILYFLVRGRALRRRTERPLPDAAGA